jgi:hypothetical protein
MLCAPAGALAHSGKHLCGFHVIAEAAGIDIMPMSWGGTRSARMSSRLEFLMLRKSSLAATSLMGISLMPSAAVQA